MATEQFIGSNPWNLWWWTFAIYIPGKQRFGQKVVVFTTQFNYQLLST